MDVRRCSGASGGSKVLQCGDLCFVGVVQVAASFTGTSTIYISAASFGITNLS